MSWQELPAYARNAIPQTAYLYTALCLVWQIQGLINNAVYACPDGASAFGGAIPTLLPTDPGIPIGLTGNSLVYRLRLIPNNRQLKSQAYLPGLLLFQGRFG